MGIVLICFGAVADATAPKQINFYADQFLRKMCHILLAFLAVGSG